MKLTWDEVGKRFYETGTEKGVLFVKNEQGGYSDGVAWNGLTAVTESPSGAEPNPLYADNTKYLTLMSTEEFGATVEAYTYPDEFAQCDGSADIGIGVSIGQQLRKAFGFAYRTALGNDIEGENLGYKLHLIYGALAAPSEKAYSTINDSPEAVTFSWEITTTPVEVTGFKPSASLVIDSTKVTAESLATLEEILYGSDLLAPRLPMPDEIMAIFMSATPDAIELISILPVDDATDVAVDTTIVFTFNNKIASESIVIASDAGAIIAGSKTWDTAGKVLTFTPTSNLSASSVYIVTVGGVIDTYGQALPATVKNFMTIA